MSLELNDRFLRDFEALRTQGGSPIEIERLRKAIVSLKEQGRLDLEAARTEAARQRQEVEGSLTQARNDAEARQKEFQVALTQARNDAETRQEEIKEALNKARNEANTRQKELEKVHAQALALKNAELTDSKDEARRKIEEARAQTLATLPQRIAQLEAEFKEKQAAARQKLLAEMEIQLIAERERVTAELMERWAWLTSMPLGMRVSSFVLDALIVGVAALVVRSQTEWGMNQPGGMFLIWVAVAFSLRAIASPANLLLGISPRHIGPDQQPVGSPGLGARLVCGFLHYGPLVATAAVAALDPPTARGLMELLNWATHPTSTSTTLGEIMQQLLRPNSPGLPGVILAITLVWWSLLLVALFLSPLMHWGIPYFRNTTLVEWMWRVGYQRFSPPGLGTPKADVGG